MDVSRNRKLELENSMLRQELHKLQLEHEINRMQHEIDEASMRLDMLASPPLKLTQPHSSTNEMDEM
ncbi:hypothetical protein DPMN_012555 [Dreissena polymorpha]|uniref:Uncharacterized protein n=1 Tax=Dreissena polymorpha TaxID=45954 RepID=A0A9D4N771_DREPO|nr:hypothetical protein DPMN_012555 [Dreissena polymorpha]